MSLSSGSTVSAPRAALAPASQTGPLAAIIPSSTLFQDRREITISHEGAIYRLRITRQGKLILNK
ncbi:MAG: hemin uptake protein HemP [Hoeflea sp.]|nr:hemin uptake protein HemP [Hoeflea sp.]